VVVVVLLPLGLLMVALPLALATAVVLAVLSPLIAIVWWLWRMLAPRRRSSTMAA
jgi:ABC-type transport system involved in cytochrome bd biosynthesis fused ATPase/permease subunit